MPLMRCLSYLHEYETTKSAKDQHSDIIFLGLTLYGDNLKKTVNYHTKYNAARQL